MPETTPTPREQLDQADAARDAKIVELQQQLAALTDRVDQMGAPPVPIEPMPPATRVIRGEIFDGTNPDGFALEIGEDNVIIVDCVFKNNGSGLLIQKGNGRGKGNWLKRVTVLRCRFINNYTPDRHCAGLVAAQVEGLAIEDCYFDHNGWAPGGERSGFNHNCYLRRCRDLEVRGNVFRRASYLDLKLRTEEIGFDGVTIENNAFVENALALDLGTNEPGNGLLYRLTRIRNNVFAQTQPWPDADSSGTAMKLGNAKNATVEDNLFVDSAAKRTEAIRVRGKTALAGVIVRHNTTDFRVPLLQDVWTTHPGRKRREVRGLVWSGNDHVSKRSASWDTYISNGGDVQDAAAINQYFRRAL